MNIRNENEDGKLYLFMAFTGIALIFLIGFMIWGCCSLGRIYDVWAQRKEGEAELARAESNRSIKTLEAKAHEESAHHMANAEIIRAKGVAESNKIIGESLKQNDSYLRYLWITNLECPNKEIIYVPTEANIPILEAGRR